MNICVFAYVCVWYVCVNRCVCIPGASGSQKKVLDIVELDLAVNYHVVAGN